MKNNDFYIIADSSDNSITLSPGLCSELKVGAKQEALIFVFKISGTNTFAFKQATAKFAKRAQCGIVSYNPMYKSYGFVSLIPTVNMMFYDMGISADQQKLEVEKTKLPGGSYIYVIKAKDDKGS